MADAGDPGGKVPKTPASVTVNAEQVAVVLAKLIEDRVSKAFQRHDKVVNNLYSELLTLNKEVSEQYNIGSSAPLPVIIHSRDNGDVDTFDDDVAEAVAENTVKSSELLRAEKADPGKPTKPSNPRSRPRPGGRTSKREISFIGPSAHMGPLPRYGDSKGRKAFEERELAFSAKQRRHRVGKAYEIVRKAKTVEAKSMIKRAQYARKHNGVRGAYNNVTSVTGKPRLGYKSRALSLARRQKIRMQTQRMLNERRHQEALDDIQQASKLHEKGDEDRQGAWKLKSKLMKASNKAILRKRASELRGKLVSKNAVHDAGVAPRVATVNKSLRSHDRKFLAAAVQEQKRTLLETYGFRDVRHSRSMIYRPTNAPPPGSDNPSDHFPGNNLQLEFIYGLGMNGEGGMHVPGCFFSFSGDFIYSTGNIIVLMDVETRSQRYFCEHNEDVTAIARHPDGKICASVQAGHYKKSAQLLVWNSANIDAPPLCSYSSFGSRVSCLDFSPDGKLLLVLSVDTNELSVILWEDGTLIETAKAHFNDVYVAKFNDMNYVGEVEFEFDDEVAGKKKGKKKNKRKEKGNRDSAKEPERAIYTIITCGIKHVKFWTLTKVVKPMPNIWTSFPADGTFESIAGRKALREEQAKRRKMTYEELPKEWYLCGEPGFFDPVKPSDQLSAVSKRYYRKELYLRVDSPNQKTMYHDGDCGLPVSTSRDGSIYIWRQGTPEDLLAVDPEYEYDETEQKPKWEPEGWIEGVIKNAHGGSTIRCVCIYRLEQEGKQFVVSGGDDNTVRVWAPSDGHRGMNTMWSLAKCKQTFEIKGALRLCISPDNEKVIVASKDGLFACALDRNSILGNSVSSTPVEVPPPKLLVGAFGSTVSMVSLHPQKDVCAVACRAARSVPIYNYAKHNILKRIDLPDGCESRSISFSNNGSRLAIGLHNASFAVFDVGKLESGDQPRLVIHSKMTPKHIVDKLKAERAHRRHGTHVKEMRPNKKAPTHDARDNSASQMRHDEDAIAKDKGRARKGTSKDDDEVAVIRFAPSDELIACATHDALVYLYETTTWTRLGSCRGHSSMVKSIDFAVVDGSLKMQTNDAAKEILYWDLDAKGGSLHLTPVDLRDVEWHDRTCTLGWAVRGLWYREDGSTPSVLSLSISNRLDEVVACDDEGIISLYNYPASSSEACRKVYDDHAGHPCPSVDFSFDGGRVLSCSGVCMYQWSHVREDGFSRVCWPPKKRLMMAVKALSGFASGNSNAKLDVNSVFKASTEKKESKNVHFAAEASSAKETSLEAELREEVLEVDRGGVNGDLFALLHNMRLKDIAAKVASAGFKSVEDVASMDDNNAVAEFVKSIGLKKPESRRFKRLVKSCKSLVKGKRVDEVAVDAAANDQNVSKEKEATEKEKENGMPEEADESSLKTGEVPGDGAEDRRALKTGTSEKDEKGQVPVTAKEEARKEETDLEAIADEVATELGEN